MKLMLKLPPISPLSLNSRLRAEFIVNFNVKLFLHLFCESRMALMATQKNVKDLISSPEISFAQITSDWVTKSVFWIFNECSSGFDAEELKGMQQKSNGWGIKVLTEKKSWELSQRVYRGIFKSSRVMCWVQRFMHRSLKPFILYWKGKFSC